MTPRVRILVLAVAVMAAVAGYFAFWGPGIEPVLDRSVVGSRLSDALNDYYADHAEYPPYLFGDVNSSPTLRWKRPNPLKVSGSHIDMEGFEPIGPDPLLKGGYLRSYPLAWWLPEHMWSEPPVVQWIYILKPHAPPLSKNCWRCAFSSPGDYVARTEDGRELDWAAYVRAEWDLVQLALPASARDAEAAPLVSSRFFTLGGREGYRSAVQTDSERKGDSSEQVYSLHSYDFYIWPTKTLPFFGYQRGEWFGEGKQECWLWFYGSSAWSVADVDSIEPQGGGNLLLPPEVETPMITRPPVGLDLLNTSTGELEPDGIPDGICLLYKLKDGEIVEVVRAEGI